MVVFSRKSYSFSKNGSRAKALAWRVLTFNSSNHAVVIFRFLTSSGVENAHISLNKSSSRMERGHILISN